MNKLFTILVIISLLTIVSCSDDFFDTTLEIDPPEYVEKMAATIFVNMSDGTAVTTLTKNRPVLQYADFLDQEVANADIVSNFDGAEQIAWDYTGFQCCASYENYTSDTFDINDNRANFSISIESVEFPEKVTANSYIPSRVLPSGVVFLRDGGLDIDGDESSSFEVSFEDPAGEENYYELSVAIKDTNFPDLERYYTIYAQTLDPNHARGGAIDALLFDDSQFDGQEHTLTLQVSRVPEQSADIDRFYIIFRSITEEYYLHSKTAKQQDDNGDNPFASPTQVFSNIEGGVGILSVFYEEYIKAVQ